VADVTADRDDVLARLPLREDLRGLTPYGAPQLDVPVQLNTNENSHDVPDEVIAAIVDAVRHEAKHLNRYPDREILTQSAELAVGVTIDGADRFGERARNALRDGFGNGMGVLVDVESDTNVLLGRTVWGEATQVVPDGQISQRCHSLILKPVTFALMRRRASRSAL
jgi:hypothetical protein